MASAGFVRYTGYDNADIFKNMLIEAYAAAKKNGLFFEGKIPMASTAEVSAAANYAAGDFSDVKSVKAGLQSWLSTQRIECDAGAMAEALTEASRNCGANGRNTYLVIFCWLMKYLAVRPQSLVLAHRPVKGGSDEPDEGFRAAGRKHRAAAQHNSGGYL